MIPMLIFYCVMAVFGLSLLIFMETSAGKRWLESYD